MGERIRELRHALGLSMQQLADRSGIGSKGHVSNIERGLVRPNVQTLAQIAAGLDVLPLDLLTLPHRSPRERLVDATRLAGSRRIADALRLVNGGAAGKAKKKSR